MAAAGKDLIFLRAEMGSGERRAGRRSLLTHTWSQPAMETVQGCPGATYPCAQIFQMKTCLPGCLLLQEGGQEDQRIARGQGETFTKEPPHL